MFFQTMFQMMQPGVAYNLTLSRTENRLTVLVMPKVDGLKDTAQNNLVPFSMTGTAAEIDMGFFPALQQPLARTAGMLTNMAAYEKQVEKVASGSKSAKDQKGKEDKAEKEKKEKYDKCLKNAAELETAGKLDEAMIQLQQARLSAAEKDLKTVDEKIAALRAKTSQGSLFEVPATQPAPPPVQSEQKPPQEQAAAPVQTPVQSPQPQPAQPAPQGDGIPAGNNAGMNGSPAPVGGNGYEQHPPQGYPGYPPQQHGYTGMFPPPNGYGNGGYPPPYPNGYPQNGNGHGGMHPGHGFSPDPVVYNPNDYKDMPDVEMTHVGRIIHQQSPM